MQCDIRGSRRNVAQMYFSDRSTAPAHGLDTVLSSPCQSTSNRSMAEPLAIRGDHDNTPNFRRPQRYRPSEPVARRRRFRVRGSNHRTSHGQPDEGRRIVHLTITPRNARIATRSPTPSRNTAEGLYPHVRTATRSVYTELVDVRTSPKPPPAPGSV